jgi:hypothetical protein
MLNKVHSGQLPISNWPIVDKVAFWNEDKLAMKIAKVVFSEILLPLAFMMDLINKAIIYVWPKDRIVKPEALAVETAGGSWFKSVLDKAKKVWSDHDKAIIYTIVGLGLTASMYYFFPTAKVKALACNYSGHFCTKPPINDQKPIVPPVPPEFPTCIRNATAELEAKQAIINGNILGSLYKWISNLFQ